MQEYHDLLEEEIFKAGPKKGNLRTALTILTDMLIELNALDIYYQKPGSKAISPSEITTLRRKVEAVKKLLHDSMDVEG
ncbi:MAG TPA: hypothetical protein VG537_02255 [Candidatus Kapabacteria bacterium]|jgi:hypothetical protein|nr:hypothetical protein [Candidatus Kapabacteria bacterium]